MRPVFPPGIPSPWPVVISSTTTAANMTPGQRQTFKDDISADPVFGQLPNNGDTAIEIAAAYNAMADPVFWAWKTDLSEHEITRWQSPDGTVWSWPAFIARSVGEQAGWARMFNGTYTCDAGLVNVRQGFADIFSGGSNNAPAQRAHLISIARRPTTRLEKVLAVPSAAPPTPSGALGSATNVATLTYEGPIDYVTVYKIRADIP